MTSALLLHPKLHQLFICQDNLGCAWYSLLRLQLQLAATAAAAAPAASSYCCSHATSKNGANLLQ